MARAPKNYKEMVQRRQRVIDTPYNQAARVAGWMVNWTASRVLPKSAASSRNRRLKY